MKKSESKENNFLVIPDVTKKKKAERAKYLGKRIDDLFSEMKSWIEGTEFEMKKGRIKIERIILPYAEISADGKLLAALKPAGLWGFGVNIQLNIESGKETNFIFDTASETAEPDWKLIYKSGKTPKKLSKIIFRNFLRKLKKSN